MMPVSEPPAGVCPVKWVIALRFAAIQPTAWQEPEMREAVAMYNGGMQVRHIGEILGRTETAVSTKLFKLGMVRERRKNVSVGFRPQKMPPWVRYTDVTVAEARSAQGTARG